MFFVHPAASMSNGLMDWDFSNMIQNHAHFTIGGDWAFQDPAILPSCALILDGIAATFPAGADSKKKAAEAICRMITVARAIVGGSDGTVGTISLDKNVNFIKVDRDLSKGEFGGAKILGTWFEGERVFQAS